MLLLSRMILTTAVMVLVCGELVVSTSTAEPVASPKGPNSRKALAKVGACAETTITRIADRFDEPLSPTPFKSGEKRDEDGEPLMDSGTYVQYQNGAEQIDAEWNAGVAHSKLGDPVRLCTVWKPKKCPPGDDRGRIYKATNLRTNETWQMSESWHSCGGA
ncbi:MULTISPECIES: hypothetical protein [unclassified Bradyrhizobium]|uniref:hypothetical protein n=1 Tax=unclassified Bradyrhizobium TaxID=2631580 RepID=UPI0028EEE4C9|nr:MULTISPECIES: hypothetical protein [unclassified Bradyrhizobium]